MRKVEDIMHTVKVWDFLFFFKQCYVLSKTVLSLQEIGAVSIETYHGIISVPYLQINILTQM